MRKRFVQIEGALVEVERDFSQEPRAEVHIIGDIKGYRSMIDGSWISSRSKHREHLRAYGCVEVGNDSSITNPKPKPLTSPPGLKEQYIRAVNETIERHRR